MIFKAERFLDLASTPSSIAAETSSCMLFLTSIDVWQDIRTLAFEDNRAGASRANQR